MAAMHRSINDQLAKMQNLEANPQGHFINCSTCHRGNVDPLSTDRWPIVQTRNGLHDRTDSTPFPWKWAAWRSRCVAFDVVGIHPTPIRGWCNLC